MRVICQNYRYRLIDRKDRTRAFISSARALFRGGHGAQGPRPPTS